MAAVVGLPDGARRELIMNRKVSYEGGWVFIVCSLCVLAGLHGSPLRDLVDGALGVDRGDHSSVGYLRGKVANGACAAGVLLVVCVFAATVWKRYVYWPMAGAFGAWFVLMPQIIYALALLWRCLNLTSQTQASALLQDKELLPSAGTAGCYSGIAILLVLSGAHWLYSRHRAAGDRAQADSNQGPFDSSP
jgi:hypothetical protein